MNLTTIITIPGNLRDAYKQAVPGTMRHVDELINDWRNNLLEEIVGYRSRYRSFFPGNGQIYFKDGEIPKLAITREADNLVLRHIDEAFQWWNSRHSYYPDPAEAEIAINAKDTEVFDLTRLDLKRESEQWSSLDVFSDNYHQLTPEGRRLAERIYGRGEDFISNMKMLRQRGIPFGRIRVLNSYWCHTYSRDRPIAEASVLGDLTFCCEFSPLAQYHYLSARLRGVRQEDNNFRK